MQARAASAATLLIALAVLAGCSGSGGGNTNVTGPSVDIKGITLGFSPSNLTIHKGQEVTWINRDSSISHTVTSDSGSELGSSSVAPGTTYKHTFNAVGTFSYHCTPHPNMKGSITVTA